MCVCVCVCVCMCVRVWGGGVVLAKVMLQRLINNITESMLPESQCGFRKNRSTIDMIFTARKLQKKCCEQCQDMFMAFVNLSKPFDTGQR